MVPQRAFGFIPGLCLLDKGTETFYLSGAAPGEAVFLGAARASSLVVRRTLLTETASERVGKKCVKWKLETETGETRHAVERFSNLCGGAL